MPEDILHSRDEKKIADALGPDYKSHHAYDAIVRAILEGERTIPNILADYLPQSGTPGNSGW